MKRFIKRHADDEFFDEIHITIIPRFKTSGLSGDEWRRSARIRLLRKGQVLAEESRLLNLEVAATYLPWFLMKAGEETIADDKVDQDLCCQPGCAEKATVVYRLKRQYCREGHASKPPMPMYRQFCQRHSRRGDCGLEDSDDNYELVEGKPGDFWAEDESPAAFGGVIEVT